MKQYDVGVLTLPDRRTSYTMVHAAVEAGFHIVDMLEEYHRRPDVYELEGLELPAGMTLDEYGDWLHETAIKNGVCFMDGIGFAPGPVQHHERRGRSASSTRPSRSIARVGGIPARTSRRSKPLRYMITWAFWHVLREYMVKLFVRQGRQDGGGERGHRPRALPLRQARQGRDARVRHHARDAELHLHPARRSRSSPRRRSAGRATGAACRRSRSAGCSTSSPSRSSGRRCVPRDVLLALIEPRLRAEPGETDVCVMYCTVDGHEERQEDSHLLLDVGRGRHRRTASPRWGASPASRPRSAP